MIMAVSMVVSHVVVVFIIVVLVWSLLLLRLALPCLNVHNIPPYRSTAAEAFISSSAVVQEGSPKDQ